MPGSSPQTTKITKKLKTIFVGQDDVNDKNSMHLTDFCIG